MTHEFSICNELRTLGITANYKGYKQGTRMTWPRL